MAVVPAFIVGQVISTDYLGIETVEAGPSTAGVIRRVAGPWDDLQTAGLSKDQLAKPFDLEHLIQDPLAPTVAELRRLAIHSNYTAIMETTTDGGFGLLFGPNRNGPVLGREYFALARAARLVALRRLAACIVGFISSIDRKLLNSTNTSAFWATTSQTSCSKMPRTTILLRSKALRLR